ncbi:MAG TPA: hypothetical protein VFA85_02635 [Terriglobales bacterium]|nr:hypothetical protein [Terriglobales bacterium]
MKRAVFCLLPLLAGLSWAQQGLTSEPTPEGTVATTIGFPIERVITPTQADLNCAGFISKSEPKNRFVTGGLESPFTAFFGVGDAIYLHGKGFEAGQKYTVVRELADPNRFELFPGQFAALKAAGDAYSEVAIVRVFDTRPRMAVARVEFGCDTVSPGDLVIPYVETTTLPFHPPVRFDRYALSGGQASGRIVLSKDFDSELGNGGKVYINIGANQGVRVGDFLRVERTAGELLQNPVDSLSFSATSYEMTQKYPPEVNPTLLDRSHGPVIHTDEMPRRGVGEIVILSTTPTTATGMIVFSLEPVHLGDSVEVDRQ